MHNPWLHSTLHDPISGKMWSSRRQVFCILLWRDIIPSWHCVCFVFWNHWNHTSCFADCCFFGECHEKWSVITKWSAFLISAQPQGYADLMNPKYLDVFAIFFCFSFRLFQSIMSWPRAKHSCAADAFQTVTVTALAREEAAAETVETSTALRKQIFGGACSKLFKALLL